MPYIKPEEREVLRPFLEPLLDHIGKEALDCEFEAGHLNYVLTKIILAFLTCGGKFTPGYSSYNEVIGVLESCKLEFYRMQVAKYEAKKIKENGLVQ